MMCHLDHLHVLTLLLNFLCESGGKFLSDPIRYEGVAINYFDGNERDCWSAQELRNMVEKLGYMSYGKL